MATNQQRKQRQRRHILAVAQDLFIRDGFKATHVTTIAAQADVSQVTLYKYFPSKLALGHEVVLNMVTGGYRDFQKIVDDPTLSYQEIVQLMIRGSNQITDKMHANFYQFVVAEMQSKHGSDEVMRAYKAGKKHFWDAVIQRGRAAGMIQPNLSDEVLMMYLDMFTQYVSSPAGQQSIDVTNRDPEHFQEMTKQLDHLFFYGFIGAAQTQTKEGPADDN